MTLDLSYINEQPSEAQEEAIKKAIEQECLKAIYMYLTQLADLMDDGNLPELTSEQLRAMADVMKVRSESNE